MDFTIIPDNWSRATGEFGEEDVKEPKHSPLFLFAKNVSEKKLSCKSLLIGVNGAGACFLKIALKSLKKTLIASLILPEIAIQESTLEGDSINDPFCSLYQLDDDKNVIICQCFYDVASTRTFDWVEVLMKHVSADRIFIFDKLQKSEYKTEESPQAPFLRVMQTKKDKDLYEKEILKLAPYLEPPNIISGLAAEIMTYCQVHQLQAVLFISLESNTELEVETLKAFEVVLKYLKIEPKEKIDYKLLHQYKRKTVHSLYL